MKNRWCKRTYSDANTPPAGIPQLLLTKKRRFREKLRDDPSNILTYSGILKFKFKFTNDINATGNNDVEITVPLKFLTKFWRILELLWINYETNLILIWLAYCLISNAPGATTYD